MLAAFALAAVATAARADGDAKAERTFDYANQVEKVHARLYTDALEHLEDWKVAAPFYVCPVCGETVSQVDFSRCPVCATKGDLFEKIC